MTTTNTNAANTYERLEFDADGAPVICTYLRGQPWFPIACRPA